MRNKFPKPPANFHKTTNNPVCALPPASIEKRAGRGRYFGMEGMMAGFESGDLASSFFSAFFSTSS